MIQKLAQRDAAEHADYGTQGEKRGVPHPSLSLSSGLGRAVYASYSDEALLDVLRASAARIGRAPTQSEVFSLYRIYLKARFGTWPAALRAAGMRRLPTPDLTMPDWERMLREEPGICGALRDVTVRRERLGYPPRKRDVSQAKVLCERFCSWENVIAAAESFQTWQKERGIWK